MNRWQVLFAAAMLVALVAGYVLRDTPGYMVAGPDGTSEGDLTHYVYWTRLVTLGGIQSAYSGTWPRTYAVYPPVPLYPFEAVGSLYRWLQDPSFGIARAQQSLWLREAIKFTALAWHLLTAGALFWAVRRLASERLAAVAAALYVVNPATLYDVAHWGQPDGAHSLFSVLGVGLLSMGRVLPAWAAIAAAALSKPQAWAILPLLVLATLHDHGGRGLGRGLATGAAIGCVLVLPFVVTGHLLELFSLPRVVSSVMPVVSADAHNLWQLMLQPRGTDPIFVFDSDRIVGRVSYRMIAAVLVGGVMLTTAWLYWTRRASLAEAAALDVLGWFTFTTQAHENHLFFAVPLLSLAWPPRRRLLVPLGLVSLSLLMNMVLHDQLLLNAVGRWLDGAALQRLRLANAGLNVVLCVGWVITSGLRSPGGAGALVSVARYRPEQARRVGLEDVSDERTGAPLPR